MIEHYSPKVEKIFQSTTQQVGTRWHLARQKMIFALIFSIIETRSVQFPELATKLKGSTRDESNLRRIQAFFAKYELDYRVIACVLMSFVTTKKCRISIDRTNGAARAVAVWSAKHQHPDLDGLSPRRWLANSVVDARQKGKF